MGKVVEDFSPFFRVEERTEVLDYFAGEDSALGKSNGLWQIFAMSTLAVDLQTTLKQLDPDSASKLERLVRDAMDLAQSLKTKSNAVDANGWPIGHFEKFAGCLAGEQWDLPDDAPPEPTPEW